MRYGYDQNLVGGVRHTCLREAPNDEQSSFDFRNKESAQAARVTLIKLNRLSELGFRVGMK